MRERSVDVDELNCCTKDNVPVTISGTLFFKVNDSEKACFSVEDYEFSVATLGESIARTIIGRFDYDTIIRSRNEISDELKKIIGDSICDWGVGCTRFEIKIFEPQSSGVAKHLEKQMEAERSRRENELNTLALVRTAEGNRDAEKLKAYAKFYIVQKNSEAEKYEVDQKTKAIVGQIKEIKQVCLDKIITDAEILNFILEKERLVHLQELAKNNSNKTYFIDPKSIFPSVKAFTDELK
jgi:regulator of protease activity HflC (stomatin/prohibitin superfamily)